MPAISAAGKRPSLAEQRRTIGIGEHRFEKFGALDQTGFKVLPFSGLDDERHMAERPWALDAGGILVDAIENAGTAQITVGGGEAAIDLLGAERRQHCQEGLPVRAHAPVAVHHFIENAGKRPIRRDELREACGVCFDKRVALG